MVDEEISGNAVNTHFLINEIFEGNANKALKVARRYPRVTYTLTPKSVERYLILEGIEVGLTDEEIIEAYSTDEDKIRAVRVKRLREEFKNGKRN